MATHEAYPERSVSTGLRDTAEYDHQLGLDCWRIAPAESQRRPDRERRLDIGAAPVVMNPESLRAAGLKAVVRDLLGPASRSGTTHKVAHAVIEVLTEEHA